MNYLALQLFDEETSQPLRVSLNPRYVVTVMAYTVEDRYVMKTGAVFDGQPELKEVPAVSITFELHHENQIDLLLPHDDAQMLIACLHKEGWVPDQVFNDIRNRLEDSEE